MLSKSLLQIILFTVLVALLLRGIINRITGKNIARNPFNQKIVDIITMKESFGVSPGTMTQLAANHVPTVEDIPMLKQWVKERQEGIWQMTESDLVGKAPIEYSILGSRIGAFA